MDYMKRITHPALQMTFLEVDIFLCFLFFFFLSFLLISCYIRLKMSACMSYAKRESILTWC